MEDKIIEFKNIFLEVKNEDKNVSGNYVKLLDGISGRFKSGILTAVMGASGAGKSTLFDVLLGRIDDDSKTYGEVLYNGSERNDYEWIHKVSYLKQDDCYFSKFTIQESIMFNLNLYQPFMSKKDKLQFSDEILNRANIYDKRLAYIESLSGGERKRAMIALSMCSDPDVIFMDEPTSGLDSHSALVLINFMKKYAIEKNKIVVISLHQPGEALFNLFDEILYLGKGGVFYDGKISDIPSWLEEKGMPKPDGISLAEYLFELHSATPFPPEIARSKPTVDQIIADNRAKYDTIRGQNVLRSGLTSLYFEMSFSIMAVIVLIKRFYLNYYRNNSLIIGTISKVVGLIVSLGFFYIFSLMFVYMSLIPHGFGCTTYTEIVKKVKDYFTPEMRRHLSYYFFRVGRSIQILIPSYVFNFFDNRAIAVEDVYSGRYSVLTYFIAYFLHDMIYFTYLFAIPILFVFFTPLKGLTNYWYFVYFFSLIPLCVINYMFIRLVTSKPGSSSKVINGILMIVLFLGSSELSTTMYEKFSNNLNLPDAFKYIQCFYLIFPQFLLTALFSYKNVEKVNTSNIHKNQFHNYIPSSVFSVGSEKKIEPSEKFKFVCLEDVSFSVFVGIFIVSTLVNLFGALYLFNRQIRANLRLKLTK